MEEKFLKDSTLIAFKSWQEIGGGFNPHPNDIERFYKFAYEYYSNKENLSDEMFSKMCKEYNADNFDESICQKYYDRLKTICDFIKWYNINNKK